LPLIPSKVSVHSRTYLIKARNLFRVGSVRAGTLLEEAFATPVARHLGVTPDYQNLEDHGGDQMEPWTQ
jgi:hypothetical protein